MNQVDETDSKSRHFCILHFNDCYNVEPRNVEPVGGAARFVQALRSFDHLEPLVLFSGDIIAPSMMSAFTKGKQMIPVLDKCKIDCALFGNHEFDYGLEYLISFTKKTNFPWLMSNLFFKPTQRPLGEGKIMHLIEKNGIKIALIGLIEEEWISSLVMDSDDIQYIDFISEGRRLAQSLKKDGKVDFIIALTHMRTYNDIKLAKNVEEIDLILGGHDHVYEVQKINGKFVVKSGTDFQQFSKIDITIKSNKEFEFDIEEIKVTSKFPEDLSLVAELETFKTVIEDKMENIIAFMDCDLDGKFETVRSEETNLGNLIADIMLDASVDGDFVLLNSGTLRSDRVHPKGPFKMRDLVTILPFMDSILVLKITGEQVLRAIENGVSHFPSLDGRFPQVSGITFSFDPSGDPGSRIDVNSIKIGGNAFDRSKDYKIVTKEYIAQGKDGYNVLKECEIYKTTEDCMPMIQAVQEYFEARKLLQNIQFQNEINNNRRQSIIRIYRRNSMLVDNKETQPNYQELCHLCPKIEGRITLIN